MEMNDHLVFTFPMVESENTTFNSQIALKGT